MTDMRDRRYFSASCRLSLFRHFSKIVSAVMSVASCAMAVGCHDEAVGGITMQAVQVARKYGDISGKWYFVDAGIQNPLSQVCG